MIVCRLSYIGFSFLWSGSGGDNSFRIGVCVLGCGSVDGVWADGGSVRTDEAHFLKIKCQARMRVCLEQMFTFYIYFMMTERAPTSP